MGCGRLDENALLEYAARIIPKRKSITDEIREKRRKKTLKRPGSIRLVAPLSIQQRYELRGKRMNEKFCANEWPESSSTPIADLQRALK